MYGEVDLFAKASNFFSKLGDCTFRTQDEDIACEIMGRNRAFVLINSLKPGLKILGTILESDFSGSGDGCSTVTPAMWRFICVLQPVIRSRVATEASLLAADIGSPAGSRRTSLGLKGGVRFREDCDDLMDIVDVMDDWELREGAVTVDCDNCDSSISSSPESSIL